MNKTKVSAGYAWLKASCMVLLLMVFALGASAQNVNVFGTVTDANSGEEVIGATVKVKGSTAATISDMEGKYKLAVKPGSTIEVTYVGY